jgi:hypothetical protein
MNVDRNMDRTVSAVDVRRGSLGTEQSASMIANSLGFQGFA